MASFKNVGRLTETEEQNTSATGPKMVGSIPESAELQWSPLVFQSFGHTTRITNDELARRIRTAYGATFHDLKGCNVTFLNGNFNVELFFEVNTDPVPDGKINNLDNLTAPINSGNLFYRNQVVQHKLKGESFTINDETKLLLSDCMYGGRQANKPNSKRWKDYVTEIHVPLSAYSDPFFRQRNAERVMVRVTGLDLRRILQKLYGDEMVISTSTDGESAVNNMAKAFYEPRFIKMLPNGTFVMNIEQFDKAAVEQFVVKENPQLQQTTGVVYY